VAVVFANTFRGGAAVSANTLTHNPDPMQPVMNAPMVLGVGQRVAITQVPLSGKIIGEIETASPA
jgi:hypothetical protein